MLMSIAKEKILKGSNPKSSLDVDNGDPKKIYLPNGNGLSKIKSFDRMVKRKSCSGTVPCVKCKKSMC